MSPDGREKFLAMLEAAMVDGSIVKLTLGKPSCSDPSLENLFVRPVTLKSGPRFAFVWHHRTRDITKNYSAADAVSMLRPIIGADFLDAHLFTTRQSAQLETGGKSARLRVMAASTAAPGKKGHDREKKRPIPAGAAWLRALGVTDERGRPASGMADKFRQIERFAEILGHLISEAPLGEPRRLRVFDMGSGKGYLTFATSELLGSRAEVCGVEIRGALVDFCSRIASDVGLSDRLSFRQGTIADTDIGTADVLIALHACDTATDDALAKGIKAGSALIVVAPCCQKEIRPQLVARPVLADALSHGIFAERQAEFATDALRALLLEWAGYRTRVSEFISTEHTAKNIMIAGVRGGAAGSEALAGRIRAFAAFYGIRRHALAGHLGFALP